MKRLFLLATCAVFSCNTAEETTRFFRVVIPVTTTFDPLGNPVFPLPDACYQAADLPVATVPAQQGAEAFCGVRKKSTASGMSSENVVQQETWTLLDVGDQNFSLQRSFPSATVGGALIRSGMEGRRADNKFLFESTTRSWSRQCPFASQDAGFGPQVTLLEECDGKCINTRSDPAHCGGCNRPCPGNFACQFGSCTPSCGGQFFQFCDGGQVNVAADPNNCGFCGNVCPEATICTQGFNGTPQCASPCTAFCSQASLPGGCGVPTLMNKDITTAIDFTMTGTTLAGNVTQATVYSCAPPGCAADFPERCPNCTIQLPISGRESVRVQEFEPR